MYIRGLLDCVCSVYIGPIQSSVLLPVRSWAHTPSTLMGISEGDGKVDSIRLAFDN
jgi:hypothetical protein